MGKIIEFLREVFSGSVIKEPTDSELKKNVDILEKEGIAERKEGKVFLNFTKLRKNPSKTDEILYELENSKH